MQQLDPLLRKSDRGAWRARAFILAMNGDVAGAEQIATTMMPRGHRRRACSPSSSGCRPCRPSDRAFAVHFGEVARDARRGSRMRGMAPPLPRARPPIRPRRSWWQRSRRSRAVAATTGKTDKRDRAIEPRPVQMAAATPTVVDGRTAPTSARVAADDRRATYAAAVPARTPYAAPVQLAAAPIADGAAAAGRDCPAAAATLLGTDVAVQAHRANRGCGHDSGSLGRHPAPTPDRRSRRTVPAPSTPANAAADRRDAMAAIPPAPGATDPTRAANAPQRRRRPAPPVATPPTPVQQAPVQHGRRDAERQRRRRRRPASPVVRRPRRSRSVASPRADAGRRRARTRSSRGSSRACRSPRPSSTSRRCIRRRRS